VAQRQLELRAEQRQRCAELVPRVGDELALALESRLEPGQHLVQRLTEPLELVARLGHRQPLARRLGRDRGGAATHRLDRAKREPGEHVAGHRGEHERDRPGDQQLVAQARERLDPVLPRRADDEHEPSAALLDRGREQPRRLVEAGDRRAVCVDRLAPSALELAPGEQVRPAERGGRIDDPAGRRDELGVALAALDEAAPGVRRQCRSRPVDERGDVLRAHEQVVVERRRQVRVEPRVEKQAGEREHCGHRDRERCGDPKPDRDPRQAARTARSLYPAPRTVCNAFRPNGSSILFLRCLT
jgi:hypothetical protein